MRSTSYTWRKLVENGEFHMQTVARIYGATGNDSSAVSGSDSRGSYREYAAITAPNITHGLLQGNALSIGNCVSGTLNFTVKTTDTIPKSAKIVIRSRVTNGNPDNLEYSEYLEFGTYWVDHRSYNDDYIDLECYDAMKMANQYCDYSIFGYDDWPKTLSFVVTNIATQMGITVDSRTVSYFNEIGVWNQKIVSIPNGDDTLIKILGYIGGIIGGNWYVTYDNKLRYIPLISAPVGGHILSHTYDTITTDQGDSLIWGTIFEATETERGHITSHIDERIVAANGDYVVYDELGTAYKVNNPGGGGCVVVPVVVGSLTTANLVTVTKVTISVDTETSYTYGVDDGFEINVQNNPYADDSRVKDLYDRIKGLVYQPFNATNSVYDPAAELGDWVIVGDIVRGIMYSESIKLDVGFSADISAPGEDELESEYPFVTIEERVTQSIEKTAVEIKRDTKSAVENATSQITGADGGYVRFMYDDDHNFNEILIMDNYDVSTASKVWRWNRGGLGYSSNGYNGPYGLAITQDGSIVADYINTGTLDADKVNVEHLKANKITSGILGVGDGKVTIDGLLTDSSRTNYWNLTDGTFQIKGTADGDVAAIRVTKGSDGKTTATINASKITAGTLNAQNITISNLDKNEANKSQIVSIADGVIKTAELKSTAGNDNYWNLVTGEFKIKSKSANTNAIYVKDGNVTINADNITTGTLKTVNNANNYWNLSNGLFKVQGSNDSAAAIEVGSDGKAKINASSITVGTINAAQIGDKSISNAKLSGSATGGIDNSWSLNFNTGAFTIGKITANSVVTGEIKNNGNRYNYWNLDSGDFRVGGSDSNDYGIKVTRSGTEPNYTWTTNINADKLTIGTIQAKAKQGETVNTFNKWNLATGELKVGKSDTDYAIWVKQDGSAIINANKITTGTLNVGGNLTISGMKTSDLNNDSGFQNATQVTTIANGVIKTAELKSTDGTNDNYWNLLTGEFRVKAKSASTNAIYVKDGDVTINADNITTGTLKAGIIQSTNSNSKVVNKWNLNTGEFRVGGTSDSGNDYAIKVNADGSSSINISKITTGLLQDANKWNYWNLETGELRVGKSDSNYAILVNSSGTAKINASSITVGTIDENSTFGQNFVSIVNGKIDARELNASKITTGTLDASKITISGLDGTVTTITNDWIKTVNVKAQNLQVNAAKVDGTLTASQIDATDLKVKAANITGNLSASRIQGGTLTLGGSNNGNGYLVMQNSAGNQYGYWNNSQLSIGTGFSVTSAGKVTITDGKLTNESSVSSGNNYILGIEGAKIYGGIKSSSSSAYGSIEFVNVLSDDSLRNTVNIKGAGILLTSDSYSIDINDTSNDASNSGVNISSRYGEVKLKTGSSTSYNSIEIGTGSNSNIIDIIANKGFSIKVDNTVYFRKDINYKGVEIGPLKAIDVYEWSGNTLKTTTTYSGIREKETIHLYDAANFRNYELTFVQGILVGLDYEQLDPPAN